MFCCVVQRRGGGREREEGRRGERRRGRKKRGRKRVGGKERNWYFELWMEKSVFMCMSDMYCE